MRPQLQKCDSCKRPMKARGQAWVKTPGIKREKKKKPKPFSGRDGKGIKVAQPGTTPSPLPLLHIRGQSHKAHPVQEPRG